MEFFSNAKRKKTKQAKHVKNELKAVIYVRVSDIKQLDGVSLDNQEKEIRTFLSHATDEHGRSVSYEVIKVFREEGRSGKDGYRSEFQEMIEYVRVRREEVDAVCFYAISRLGRNVRLVLETFDYLNKLDITVISKNDNLNSKTANGRFTLTILSALAQLESEQIAERVMPNMKYSVENLGRWQGARYVPYGYSHERDLSDPKRERKRLVVEPEEAEQVKKIFEWFCYGIDADHEAGEYKIAKHLNRLGMKYRNGGSWEQRQVQSIIENGHLYAGWLVWNRHGTENKTVEVTDEHGMVKDVEVMNYKKGFPKPVKTKYRKEDQEVVSGRGIHEAIITELTWERCRERLKERSNKVRKTRDATRKASHLFTHAVKCPQCGGPTGASTLQGVVYYKCQKAARGGMCKPNMIPEHFLKQTLLDVLFAHYEVYIHNNFDGFVAKEANNEKYYTETEAKLARLKIELERTNDRAAEIVHEYQSDSPNKLIRTKEQASSVIRKIEAERDGIEREMEDLQITLKDDRYQKFLVKKIAANLKSMADGKGRFESLTPEGKMDFVDRYILRVEYSKDISKKGNHAYQITKIVLVAEFCDLLDINGNIPKFQSDKLAELVRKAVGGAVDKQRINPASARKIQEIRANLPIAYENV